MTPSPSNDHNSADNAAPPVQGVSALQKQLAGAGLEGSGEANTERPAQQPERRQERQERQGAEASRIFIDQANEVLRLQQRLAEAEQALKAVKAAQQQQAPAAPQQQASHAPPAQQQRGPRQKQGHPRRGKKQSRYGRPAQLTQQAAVNLANAAARIADKHGFKPYQRSLKKPFKGASSKQQQEPMQA